MKDVIVTIRMPARLLDELAANVKRGHFLDLSEEIRSVVRARYLEASKAAPSEQDKEAGP